jgi:hypothetical protein
MGSHRQASLGKALPREGIGHGELFQEAFEDALSKLDEGEFGGDKLEVRLFVSIKPNPGGVSQYTVTLNPGGVSQY